MPTSIQLKKEQSILIKKLDECIKEGKAWVKREIPKNMDLTYQSQTEALRDTLNNSLLLFNQVEEQLNEKAKRGCGTS